MENFFSNAVAIWLTGQEREKHIRAQFKTVVAHVSGQKTQINLITSGIYQLWVNGKFVAYGPARAGRGHFRVEQWDITDFLTPGENAVVVEVCGYYVNSYYIQKQPSFLQAEVMTDGKAVLWTGRDFSARLNPHYLRYVQRYSSQRPMLEAYRVQDGDDYLTDLTAGTAPVSQVEGGIPVPRIAPYPRFECTTATKAGIAGKVTYAQKADHQRPAYLTNIGPVVQGFTLEELEFCAWDEIQSMTLTPTVDTYGGKLPADGYEVYRFPGNRTGLFTVTVDCQKPMTLYVMFEELLTGDPEHFLRSQQMTNLVRYDLPAGRHALTLFEVYTAQFIQLVAKDGDCTVEQVGIIEYTHEPVAWNYTPADSQLKKIADAAIQSFRQNSVDILTDCPHRERAGWLCDSYFFSQTEFLLTGGNPVEKSFLENYLHEEAYENMPDGMLTMCYPADLRVGNFIPNWPMWLVLELKEYLKRTGDRDLIDRYRKKVMKLLDYFAGFENEDGLLEKLDGIVFVDASKSNQLRQDLNYPTNMLYSAMLDTANALYGLPELAPKAERIRQEVLRQSFDGRFFVDNAVRKDGRLELTGEHTEACQYYAFLFNVVSKESHGDLLETLIRDFGAARDEETVYPEIASANAFIGYYLRLKLLLRYERYEELIETIRSSFGEMAELTGTLWEYKTPSASCDHGVGSYVLCAMDVLAKKGLI